MGSFTGKDVVKHKQFEADIVARFGDEAYPHRIHMSDLPEGSRLLKNPVNNMSGFFLKERYFFVPGFPEMAHTMIEEALDRFYPKQIKRHRKTLKAHTSENSLITLMKEIPSEIELSSLPMIKSGVPSVELSLASENAELLNRWFERVEQDLETRDIDYKVLNTP